MKNLPDKLIIAALAVSAIVYATGPETAAADLRPVNAVITSATQSATEYDGKRLNALHKRQERKIRLTLNKKVGNLIGRKFKSDS